MKWIFYGVGLFYIIGSEIFDTGVIKEIHIGVGTIIVFMGNLKD